MCIYKWQRPFGALWSTVNTFLLHSSSFPLCAHSCVVRDGETLAAFKVFVTVYKIISSIQDKRVSLKKTNYVIEPFFKQKSSLKGFSVLLQKKKKQAHVTVKVSRRTVANSPRWTILKIHLTAVKKKTQHKLFCSHQVQCLSRSFHLPLGKRA